MSKSQYIDISKNIEGLQHFVQRAYAIPLLSTEQEQVLAERWFYHSDLSAAKQLVLSHMRFVVKIARGYLGYGLSAADLVQEGNIGLMKAVKRFNPTLGVRLATFASYWIKSEIHEFILRNWRIVKVATTKSQRKLFFNLRGLKKRLTWLTDTEAQDIATELNVNVNDVREMEQRMTAEDCFLDIETDDQEHSINLPQPISQSMIHQDPAHLLEETSDQASKIENLKYALSQLPVRTQDILAQRWLREKKASLQELADKYQISPERVRQIEQKAIEILQGCLLEQTYNA